MYLGIHSHKHQLRRAYGEHIAQESNRQPPVNEIYMRQKT